MVIGYLGLSFPAPKDLEPQGKSLVKGAGMRDQERDICENQYINEMPGESSGKRLYLSNLKIDLFSYQSH